MASSAATLVLKVVTDTTNAAKGMDNVGKSASTFKDKVGSAAKVAGVALIGLGAAAIHAGQAAAEDAQGQAILANSMKNSAGATKAQVAQTEDYIAKMSAATGVTDDEMRPAMGNLVRATGDVTQSQKDLHTALDISAATGKSVGQVTEAMAKGYGGNTAALNRMLPAVAKTATKTGDFNKVMDEAAKVTKGAAADSADTAAGQFKIFQTQLGETEEAMGAGLLPVMKTFSTIAANVAMWAQKNAKVFQIIIVIVAAFAAAIVVLNAVLKAYTVITEAVKVAQNATWLSNPIFLVIVALVAVGVAIVVLYKKVKWFRDFVNAAWKIIKSSTKAVVSLFKSVWKAVWPVLKAGVKGAVDVFKSVWKVAVAAVKGYIQAWVAYFKLVFGVIKGVVKLFVSIFKGDWRGVFDAVRGIINSFKDFFRTIFNLLPDPVQKVITKIKDGLGGAFDWLKDKVDTVVGGVADIFDDVTSAVDDVIDSVSSLIDWISKIHIPDLGGLAGKIGGILHIAPAPPDTARGVARFAAPTVGGVGAPRAASAGGGITINVTGAIDPEATARQIQKILLNHDRRVGLVGARTP